MPIVGSPKKLAEDISKGLFSLTPPYMKTLTNVEFKAIYAGLKIVQRDVRAEQVEGTEETRSKQIRMMRLTMAINLMEARARKYRIPLA